MTYTAEEVRDRASSNICEDGLIYEMLIAYAADLERREAGVTDEIVERVAKAIAADGVGCEFSDLPELDVSGLDKNDLIDYARAALTAVWPVAAEPAQDNYQCMSCMAKDYGLQPTAEPVQPADSGWAGDALRDLVEVCEAEFCSDGTDAEPDNSKVAYPEDECHITFGHIRRARAALAAQGQPAEPVVQAKPKTLALFTANQAQALLDAFGGSATTYALIDCKVGECAPLDDGSPSPAGLYIYDINCPEEGVIYLGAEDEESEPRAVPAKRVPDVRAMVNRFLGWRLPDDFAPDCGISFDGRKDDQWNTNKTWPIGTNLLTAAQAEQMFRYVLVAPQPGELA